VRGLTTEFPAPKCALDHETPFQLLVATILSAQCTDVRVNLTTPALFAAYPDPFAMARAEPAHLEDLIRSTGFFRNKTKSLLGASVALVSDHDGEVPRSMDALLALPGVARKTANVVLGVAFGIAGGVVVDTHVARISRLLGLTDETDPQKIERDLIALLPKKEWIDFSHRMILHGRKTCIARRPRCGECRIAKDCPSRQDV
jgi:endonuclease-3